MSIYSRYAATLSLMLAASATWAGEYSPGKGGSAEAGYADAGIAGFVGSAGEGVVATSTNGNYINPIFKGWATTVVEYTPSDVVGTYGQNGIGSQFANSANALGPASGGSTIVSLGDMSLAELSAYRNGTGTTKPGTLTLGFATAICNGAGADFAAFENGFVSAYSTGEGSTSGQMFAELGFMEVSTDGVNFSRFPSHYNNYLNSSQNGKTDSKIDLDGNGTTESTAYLTQDVSNIYNLVGKHSNGANGCWGTPFDLDDLLNDPLVLAGLVDLNNINFIRIVDIPGDGSFTDSQGNSIYDSWLTWGSGGLDFDALGVINQVPEPASAMIFIGAGALTLMRRKK